MRGLMMLCLVAATPASACNANLISVQEWSANNEASSISIPATQVEFVYRYEGDKPFRMIDGRVNFTDSLGELLGTFPLNRDIALRPNETGAFTTIVGGKILERLGTVHPDDVVISTCVHGIIYDDGTKEEF